MQRLLGPRLEDVTSVSCNKNKDKHTYVDQWFRVLDLRNPWVPGSTPSLDKYTFYIHIQSSASKHWTRDQGFQGQLVETNIHSTYACSFAVRALDQLSRGPRFNSVAQ